MWNSLSVSLCMTGEETASLTHKVFLFSVLLTELNVTLLSLSTDNDVMFGSNRIRERQYREQTLLFKDQWRAKKEKERWMSVSQGKRCGRTVLVRYTLIVLTLPFLSFFPSLTGKNFVYPLSFCQKAPTEMIAIKSFDSVSPAGTGFL